jgi:hypothetical protein
MSATSLVKTDATISESPVLEEQQPITNPLIALIVRTDKPPQLAVIEHSLKSFQSIVGGLIEFAYYFPKVALIVNEEGEMDGLPPNRKITNSEGEVIEIVFGDFLAVGLDEAGEVTDISEESFYELFQLFEDPNSGTEATVEIFLASMAKIAKHHIHV